MYIVARVRDYSILKNMGDHSVQVKIECNP